MIFKQATSINYPLGFHYINIISIECTEKSITFIPIISNCRRVSAARISEGTSRGIRLNKEDKEFKK